MVMPRHNVTVAPTRSNPPLPDLSRPPPGFSRPQLQAVPVPFYQPQAMYSYEDTIVSRVLQSLIGNRVQQVEPPNGQPQDVIEKVLNWDVGAGCRDNYMVGRKRDDEGSVKSLS